MSHELYDYTRPELTELVGSWGFHALHATRLWGYLYREGLGTFEKMSDLPVRLRTRLMEEARLTQLVSQNEIDSTDGHTRKLLLRLHDGERIETVLMRFRGRVTACVSSQAGCALGCVFCATGQRGFARNLSPGEIVGQALFVQQILRDEQRHHLVGSSAPRNSDVKLLRNLVLMGMGEPLHNYDAVMTALDILRDPGGLAIGGKQITISTVGVIPGIVRMADEARPYSLAVSLHAATQTERAALIPTSQAWPLNELIDACRYYSEKMERKVFFEWTLIENGNDAAEQAFALVDLLKDLPAHVNLIPLNPTAGYAGNPGHPEAADRFKRILEEGGIPATIRQRRGIDIAAGCGQLAGDETLSTMGIL